MISDAKTMNIYAQNAFLITCARLSKSIVVVRSIVVAIPDKSIAKNAIKYDLFCSNHFFIVWHITSNCFPNLNTFHNVDSHHMTFYKHFNPIPL